MTNKLPLNAVFGPTYQGEGPHTGTRCHFIRLGRCNLSCTWCDTPDTWDHTRYDVAAENPWTSVEDILARLDALPRAPLVVLSGGEPLLHQRRPGMSQLLTELHNQGTRVHAETNGTIPPTEDLTQTVEHFTVSPKLANNGADPARKRIKPRALDAFTRLANRGKACFKFVASTPNDLTELDQLVNEYALPAHAVWVMPEGTTTDQILHTHRHLAPHLTKRPYNTTTRLHTLLWNNEKDR